MVELNKKILAFSLGDGWLNKNGKLEINHTIKQKEYLEWIETQIGSNNNRGVILFNNSGYPGCKIYKSFGQEGKEIRKKLYGVMGHKYFSKTIVENIDLYSWAVLYCDDGSLIPKKRNGKIHAYSLTISTYCSFQECKRLQKNAEEILGVKFNINKDKGKYLLRCGTKQARIFLPQIKEVLPDFECFKSTKFQSDVLKNQF